MYERLHFFRNSKSRNDALSLILITDLLWQLLREISGVSGKQKLPSPGDKFNWVYELHSNLRHPEQLYPDFEWLFNDPWPLKEANKLIDAAEAMDAVLSDITDDFDLGSGFIGEIEEKQKLASVAEANFKENRKLK
ncbi:hypothetical protein TH6_09740 [Thalassospira profundimaris]|uniref:Uncharacterized protein n=2 Tax=Thalassospiraceae TaxID=2844866 RepID=A0A367VDM3_9PROT|nr:hypothetical protein TH6_09740 [Thalassospira profundimaris]